MIKTLNKELSKELSKDLLYLLKVLPQVTAEQHAALCAQLTIVLLSHRPSSQWLGSRKAKGTPYCLDLRHSDANLNSTAYLSLTERQRERLAECRSLADVLRNFQLKGVGQDSQDGLLGWLEQRYPLDLRFDIPSPTEMLDHQCVGRRFVTFLLSEDQLFTPIGRHAGALEFMLHDLEHAHKFFADLAIHRGQRSFFLHLRTALQAGFFDQFCQEERFQTELDYLMADMNSHPLHLWKYLKAIVLSACSRQTQSQLTLEEFQIRLLEFWDWPKNIREAACRINYPNLEKEQDRLIVSAHFIDNLPISKEELHAFAN